MSAHGLVLAVSLGLSVAMAGAWLLQRRLGNGGWADAVWTFALGAAGIAYALAPLQPPATARQMLVATAIGVWSLRLGLHLALRARHGPEDARYAQLRRDWGQLHGRRLFRFLQIQAAAAAVLALAIFAAARNPAPLGAADGAALALLAVAYGGEALADAQLQRFRRNPANRGGICEQGLWRWSRHPNYFFEWLGWLAYPLLAIRLDGFPDGWPWGWFTLTAPALMYVLLVHVSGIPPLERQMLLTRGDAYRAYQARSRAFLPLPGRKLS